jgi:hypothetical protein
MFKSKIRPIVTPQSEHLKLAGALAHAWGNTDFDLPPFPLLSFVEGVALHDRGYGYLDQRPIGDPDEDKWLKITWKGFNMPASDPVADLITKLHLRRLVRSQDTPRRAAMLREMESLIEAQIAEHGFSAADFERLDRITNLCDSISFIFCFEAPARGQVMVYPRNGSDEQVAVEYELKDGAISVSPWPFGVESLRGYLIAYQEDGYPQRLEPVLMIYSIHPG